MTRVKQVDAWLNKRCPRCHCAGNLFRELYVDKHGYKVQIKCLLCSRVFTEAELLEPEQWFIGMEI